MRSAVIQTRGLTKKFKNVTAVNKLDLSVTPGIYGFLGPNGAGKTTTIKMLVGAIFPDSGDIEILGRNATKELTTIHKNIGYVPERPTYFMRMTGQRFLEYMGAVFHLSKQEKKARSDSLLKLVDLNDAKNRAIGKYSAGMKQRIGIAQALMNNPELLILDEITANLDPIGRNQIIDLLKDLRKEGKTIFVSTHILSEVQKMNADAIGIIHHGRLMMEGTVEDLNKKWGEKIIRISPNHKAIVDAISPYIRKSSEEQNTLIVETDNVDLIWEKILKVSMENKITITEFKASGLEIEQLFMKAIDNDTQSEVR